MLRMQRDVLITVGEVVKICFIRAGMFIWPFRNALCSTQTGHSDIPHRIFLIMSNFFIKGQGKYSHKASLIDVNWRGSALETLLNRDCVCMCVSFEVGLFWHGCASIAVCPCLCVSVSNWPDMVCVFQPGEVSYWTDLCSMTAVQSEAI